MKSLVASCDRLKPIRTVYTRDIRMKYFGSSGVSIDDFHRQISKLKLKAVVPLNVRIQFETAKNVMLYSYFAYRLGMVAQLQGFATLELALIENCKLRKHSLPKTPSLRKLLSIAIERKWISDREAFGYKFRRWKRPLPTVDVQDHVRFFTSWVAGDRERQMPGVRNSLAHEPNSLVLPWDSIRMLENICAVINCLFVVKRAPTRRQPI